MKKLFSIRKMKKMMLLLFLIPMFLLQAIQSSHFLRVLNEEMAQNGREILSLHQNALDDDISRIANSISSYWALDYSHSKLLYHQSDFNAYQYSYNVLKEYRSLMSLEPSIGALLLISQANHMVRGAYNDSMISYGEKDVLQAFAQNLTVCWDCAGFQSWEPVQIGQQFYLARLFRNQTAGTLCFIPLDQTLQTNLSPHDSSENFLFFADREGVPLTLDPVGKEVTLQPHQKKAYFSGNYFIVQSYSPTSNMYLVFAESSPINLRKINVLSIFILGASALVLLLLPLFFLLLKRWYLHPMEQMETALQKIRQGQMDVRFQEDQKVEELQHLSTSFNQMMDRVKQMKIAAYEKELQYRYAQLQYLQLQIRPHFFLNILKSLYGMAQGRNYEKIQTAILMISDHVRYIFHDNQDMVPLQTELHHVENYIQMQHYITSQSIELHMEIEPGLEGAQVPALCLQTFVENSCKYATVPGRRLEIFLKCATSPPRRVAGWMPSSRTTAPVSRKSCFGNSMGRYPFNTGRITLACPISGKGFNCSMEGTAALPAAIWSPALNLNLFSPCSAKDLQQPRRQRNMKVLVVDDQPDVVAGILDGVNWRALHVEKAYSALSAAEAKDLLLREKIDILLCDIEMPGESGLSLVAWLQKQDRESKCIFLTAHADFPYAQKALQLGAVDYLLQPASYENIEAAIWRAAEQLQEEGLSQVYEALGKSVERETLNFRRNVLREYLLEIRRGPQKVAEKAAAFGFLASSRAYRCTLIAVQEPGKNQIDDFLLYGIQNVLEELLQACTEQVTVLFLEQKIYLAILALADNPPEGAEQSIEQGLETLCRFGSRELHIGLSCYCSKDCVRFEGLPQEYQQLRRQHRQNVACSCGLILPKKQSTSSLKPEFPKWAGMLSQGLGDAVRSEIHSYLNQLNQEGGLTPETLFQFHEHFLPLFLGAMQHWEKEQDIFSKVDYDAIMQAYASLPQMLQFVDFVTEYVENSASKGKCQGRSQIERILSYIQKNLTRNISRSEISKALYLNPEYLSRLFKREMGIGLAEYLIQERMRLAQSLLKNTSFSISIIASRVGYVNFSHFAKVFKQEFGVSPSEYRKICDPQGK